jgi:transposase
MLALHAGVRVHLALGTTDMRRGFDGLAAQLQTVLKAAPFSGHLFLFRGKRGDLLKALWWDGQGLVLLAKRLEKGRFIWPTIAREGVVTLTTVLRDGRACLHNNAAERRMRPLALGRKNYLFAGSLEGGRRAAIIYTLVGTAELNGWDPQTYLRVLLERIADHPINGIGNLAPWNLRPDAA